MGQLKHFRKVALGALAGLMLLTLSACGPTAQMPTASTRTAGTPTAQNPVANLPKNEATKQAPVLLSTHALGSGVEVKTYRVGTGKVVAAQLAANPVLKAAGIKAGASVVVIRYTLTNTSAKPVDTISFAYNGVFIGGSGKPAVADSSYASAAARLHYEVTPVRQFTDKKGKGANWSLAPGKSASWYTDWVPEAKGVLAQNLFLAKSSATNIRVDLLKG